MEDTPEVDTVVTNQTSTSVSPAHSVDISVVSSEEEAPLTWEETLSRGQALRLTPLRITYRVQLGAPGFYSDDLRFYVVWKIPGDYGALSGAHWSLGRIAYDGITDLNQGNIGGIQWKRCNNLTAALSLYSQGPSQSRVEPRSEHQNVRVFGWSLALVEN